MRHSKGAGLGKSQGAIFPRGARTNAPFQLSLRSPLLVFLSFLLRSRQPETKVNLLDDRNCVIETLK